MKKTKQIAMALCLCLVMTVTSGCDAGDKLKSKFQKEKSSSDYVTLGEYQEISLVKSEVDARVESDINETREMYVTYKEVKKGKIKDGDTVNIYYVGRMDGKKFEGGSCTKEDMPAGFDLTIGSGSFIEGFEDGLIGKKVGETVKVKTKFPDPYPNNPDYSGKDAIFTVTINYIRGDKIYPTIDDEFVAKNLTDYKDLEDYQSTLRQHAYEEMAWEKVFNDSEIKEYPQDQVDKMHDQLYTSIVNYLEQNNFQLSDYLSAQGTTSEDFQKQLEKTAKEDVAKQLVYQAIAEAADLEVTDEEYQKELKGYLDSYGCEDEKALDEKFEGYYGTDAKSIITDDLQFKKIKSYLAENVKETDTPAETTEAPKESK